MPPLTDGDPSVKHIAVAAHVATVLLEGNPQLINHFTAWVVRPSLSSLLLSSLELSDTKVYKP